MIKKMLIANRGEIAVRIIRTCRAMGIKTVVAYSACDKDTLAVFLADEAICIGDNEPLKSYLNIGNIIAAALKTKCDAIHSGYGFLSESAELAATAEKNNILFIGPDSDILKITADKSLMKKIASGLNIPVIPSSNNQFPLILKPNYGGGGKGIAIIDSKSELKDHIEITKKEVIDAFNNSSFIYEKVIDVYKHIDIQFLADKYGNITIFPPRDCSIQKRYQKQIEETPAVGIPTELVEKMSQDTTKIAKTINYNNVGTVEFIVDKEMNYYFLEINPRLQVEHTITEEATGIDLVEQQIKLAPGKKNTLPRTINAQKHAIECRVSANTPGEISIINFPSGKDIRVDTAIYQNYEIKPYYDPLIAKIITSNKSRRIAIEDMKTALDLTLTMGPPTNVDELYELINSKDYRSGKYSHFEETKK